MKPEMLYIRCGRDTKYRFRVLRAVSGARDSEEFLNKLMDIYEELMQRYEVKKIDLVLAFLRGRGAIVVRGR